MPVCFISRLSQGMPIPAGIERPVHELEDMNASGWKSRTMNVLRVGLINKIRYLALEET